MPVVTILWLQSDAAFGRLGDDRTWPHALREIVHPLSKPEDKCGGHLSVGGGARASLADVFFARRLSEGLRLAATVPIDIALIGLPLNFFGIDKTMQTIRNVNHKLMRDPTTLHSDEVRAAQWVSAVIDAVRMNTCRIRFFTRGDPRRTALNLEGFVVEAHDSSALSEIVRKVVAQRVEERIAKTDVATLLTLCDEFESARSNVARLAELLPTANLGTASGNEGATLLGELFPDLALQVSKGNVWRSIQPLWAQARTVLGAACMPSRKALALCRLLNSRGFDWHGKPTFSMDTVGKTVIELASSSCAFMSPVEFCFHAPEEMKVKSFTDDRWLAAWTEIRDTAVRHLGSFLREKAFDPATQGSLLDLRDSLQSAHKPSDVRAKAKRTYRDDLRWDVGALADTLKNAYSDDGVAIPVNVQIGDGAFVNQRLSFNRVAAAEACDWLAKDLASNFLASSIYVTSGGEWPGEGWFAIWGDVAKSAGDINEVFSKHQKDQNGLQFLKHYFSCFSFSSVQGRLIPVARTSDSMFVSKLTTFDDQLKRFGKAELNKVGYVMILRDFPTSPIKAT